MRVLTSIVLVIATSISFHETIQTILGGRPLDGFTLEAFFKTAFSTMAAPGGQVFVYSRPFGVHLAARCHEKLGIEVSPVGCSFGRP
jgi:hypothetical protein